MTRLDIAAIAAGLLAMAGGLYIIFGTALPEEPMPTAAQCDVAIDRPVSCFMRSAGAVRQAASAVSAPRTVRSTPW